MEVTPTPQPLLSPAQESQIGLADNFETFLTLLTTQLQNQDPLSPLDSNEFTSQLVQFSSVEQSIRMNDNLESLLVITQAANAGNAVGYLGKSITAIGTEATLQNGQATWNYDLDQQAAQTTIVISDASGKVVFSTSGNTAPGSYSFTWDGKDNAGNALPDGLYTIQVSATDQDGISVPVETSVTGLVTSVEIEGLEPFLLLGQAKYKLSDILSIQDVPPAGA